MNIVVYYKSMPAKQAETQVQILPQIKEEMAISAISPVLLGAIAPSPPSWIPTIFKKQCLRYFI